MKLLFFDMEFANGQVPGSVYSFGYVTTDEEFRILTPPEDILISPECEWNEYVKENILAYPEEQVEAADAFPALYERLSQIFSECDVAVGFSVSNDNRALRKDCERYALPPLSYRWFDVEKLCRMLREHKEAHGLGGYYAAWCGHAPQNAHRSDGDALATMELFSAICRAKHVTADMMIEAYPECEGTVSENPPQNTPERRHRRRRRKKKGTATPTQGANA